MNLHWVWILIVLAWAPLLIMIGLDTSDWPTQLRKLRRQNKALERALLQATFMLDECPSENWKFVCNCFECRANSGDVDQPHDE